MGWQVKVDVKRDGAPLFTAAFDRAPITLGARADNDVVLAAPYVSGNHAVVMVSRGALVIHDRSRNGSFVDGQPVGEQREIGQHGVVSIPPFEVALRFESDDRGEWKTSFFRTTDPLPPPPPDAKAETEEVVDGSTLPTPPAAANAEAAAAVAATETGTRPVVEPRPPPPLADLPLDAGADAEPGSTVLLPSSDGAPARATLQVLAGSDTLRGTSFGIPPGSGVQIGRGELVEIQLPDRTVSRQHALLEARDEGFRLSDLESANGVFVNGNRITEAVLGDGDKIMLGQICLLFRLVEHDDDPDGETPREHLGALSYTVKPLADGMLTLDLHGQVDGYNYSQLARALDRAIEDDATRCLVIDLGGVDYVGHTALGLFVKALARLERRQGDLYLVGVGARVHQAIGLSRLGSRFDTRTFEDLEAAREAWRERRSEA